MKKLLLSMAFLTAIAGFDPKIVTAQTTVKPSEVIASIRSRIKKIQKEASQFSLAQTGAAEYIGGIKGIQQETFTDCESFKKFYQWLKSIADVQQSLNATLKQITDEKRRENTQATLEKSINTTKNSITFYLIKELNKFIGTATEAITSAIDENEINDATLQLLINVLDNLDDCIFTDAHLDDPLIQATITKDELTKSMDQLHNSIELFMNTLNQYAGDFKTLTKFGLLKSNIAKFTTKLAQYNIFTPSEIKESKKTLNELISLIMRDNTRQQVKTIVSISSVFNEGMYQQFEQSWDSLVQNINDYIDDIKASLQKTKLYNRQLHETALRVIRTLINQEFVPVIELADKAPEIENQKKIDATATKISQFIFKVTALFTQLEILSTSEQKQIIMEVQKKLTSTISRVYAFKSLFAGALAIGQYLRKKLEQEVTDFSKLDNDLNANVSAMAQETYAIFQFEVMDTKLNRAISLLNTANNKLETNYKNIIQYLESGTNTESIENDIKNTTTELIQELKGPLHFSETTLQNLLVGQETIIGSLTLEGYEPEKIVEKIATLHEYAQEIIINAVNFIEKVNDHAVAINIGNIINALLIQLKELNIITFEQADLTTKLINDLIKE